MHRRQRVREAMVSVLSGASTAAGARVYAHRAVALNTLPAVRVFIPQESVIPGQTMTEYGDRVVRMSLRVEAIVAGNDTDVEEQVDDLSEQIELAVQADPTLGGECQWCQLQSVEIDFEDDDKTVMVATHEYEAVV